MLNFSNVPEKVDKEFILSNVSEEDIFTAYGLPIQQGKFCSPLRADKRPTCNFFRNKTNRLYYRDWGTNHRFDAIGFVQWKFRISFGQALFRIWQDLILGNSSSLPSKIGHNTIHITKKEPARIRIKKRPFSITDSQWWEAFGISLNTLRYYNVYAVERVWLNDKSHYLYNSKDICYAYHFGYEEYKIYFPMREKYRFISSSTRVQGWDQLPLHGKWVVVTKSLKDVMLLYQFDVAAIALSSEAIVPSEEVLRKLKGRFEHIVLFYDNDRQGILSMQKMKKKMPCVWIPRGEKSPKDITDYFLANGKQATYNLIQYAKNKLEKWIVEKY